MPGEKHMFLKTRRKSTIETDLEEIHIWMLSDINLINMMKIQGKMENVSR